MCARLLVFAGLLLVGASFARAELPGSAGDELTVYLRYDSSASPAAVSAMKDETSTLLGGAGYRVRWLDSSGQPSRNSNFVAVVALRGTCSVPPINTHTSTMNLQAMRLASTAVGDGQVLPFSWINCQAMTQFLAPSLFRQVRSRRDFLYGRAMGRVLAHELYHVLGQTTEHSHAGVAEARVTAESLLANQFAFEGESLAKFRRIPTRTPDATADPVVLSEGEESGR